MSKPDKYIGAPSDRPTADDDDDAVPASGSILHLEVDAAQHGWRLDRALAVLCPQFSRSRLQQWIAEGQVALVPPRPAALSPVTRCTWAIASGLPPSPRLRILPSRRT